MNKKIVSNKSVLLIATMLSTMMLATSSMASLVPATAFAQVDNPDVEALLTQVSPDSASEEDTSASEEDTSASEEDTSASEEDTSASEGRDNSVVVDPVTEVNVQADANVNADTHVITDEENCDEASDEVNQGIVQPSEQNGRSDGQVGDNSIYVSPKTQISEQLGFNIDVDTDVNLAEGCSLPNDEITQATGQSSDQETGSDIETGEGSTIIIPANTRSDQIAENMIVNRDITRPVF